MQALALVVLKLHEERTSLSTMIKNYATFTSVFPDDSEESPNGEVLVPAGSALASAIAGEISAARSPYQHSFYGWKFEFKCPSGRDAWVLLQ